MLGRDVDHVATLTCRGEVTRPVVAGIMVQLRAGEDAARHPHNAHELGLYARQIVRRGEARAPCPARRARLPPPRPTICHHRGAERRGQVGVSNARSVPWRAKPEEVGQLAPIGLVEPAVFARDRRDESMSHDLGERKWKLRARRFV